MPEDVATDVYTIADRISKKPNWAGYSYRQDMVQNAVLCVILYGHNFDLTKSSNGFAWVTQVIHNSFIRYNQGEQDWHVKRLLIAEDQLQEAGKGYESLHRLQRESNQSNETIANWNRRKEKKAQSATTKQRLGRPRKHAIVGAETALPAFDAASGIHEAHQQQIAA